MPADSPSRSATANSGRWTVYGISTCFFLLSQFYRAAVAVITPQLSADLGIDTQGFALLSAAFFYAFALSQIPLALYLDRIGPRQTMIILNLVGILGALTFASAQSLGMLVLARVLLGIGMACNLMGPFKLLAAWFSPRRFATLGGLIFSLAMGGSLLAASPLVILTQTVGWRGAFLLFAGVNFILTTLLWFKVADKPNDGVTSIVDRRQPHTGFQDLLQSLSQLLQKRDYWIISLAAGVRYGIFAAMQTLYCGPYLMTVRGFSQLASGNIILAMMMGVIIGGPIFGWLSDEVLQSRKKAIIGGLLGMAVSLLWVSWLPHQAHPLWITIGFVCLGIFSSFTAILYTHIKEQVDLEHAGSAMTGINFFTMLAPGICLQGMGWWMNWRYPGSPQGAAAFQEIFIISGIVLAGIALLYLPTRDTRANPL